MYENSRFLKNRFTFYSVNTNFGQQWAPPAYYHLTPIVSKGKHWNGYPSFYLRIALVAPSPGWFLMALCERKIQLPGEISVSMKCLCTLSLMTTFCMLWTHSHVGYWILRCVTLMTPFEQEWRKANLLSWNMDQCLQNLVSGELIQKMIKTNLD